MPTQDINLGPNLGPIVFITIIVLILVGILIYSFFFEKKVNSKKSVLETVKKIDNNKCDCDIVECKEIKGTELKFQPDIPATSQDKDVIPDIDHPNIDAPTNQVPMQLETGQTVEAFDVYSM